MKERFPYYCWNSLPAGQDPENLLTIPAMKVGSPIWICLLYIICIGLQNPTLWEVAVLNLSAGQAIHFKEEVLSSLTSVAQTLVRLSEFHFFGGSACQIIKCLVHTLRGSLGMAHKLLCRSGAVI
jgi:hypothetical protein